VSAWSVNVLVPSARSQSVTRMVTFASSSLRLFTIHQAPATGGPSWHAICGSMIGSQSPRVSELTGQGLNSVMYAQSGNCAGARSPQVAKATIAQIAAILGFMLTLSQTRTARSSGKTGAFSCDSVFVSPVVSPDGLKTGRFLISWDERNNYSTRLKPVICSLLMTLAKSSKNAVLALGNPCSIR